MVKHNNAISDTHFRKDWERHVYTWFDQAPKKEVRRLKRQRKAARVFPRPVKGFLRPIVRCPSSKYNTKVREGYGFTYEELKAAGINRRGARQIGIAVDPRRRNKSNSSFEPNVARLKEYMAKLVLFPRKVAKSKSRRSETKRKTEASQKEADQKEAPQTKAPKKAVPDIPPFKQVKRRILPIRQTKPKVEWRIIGKYERKGPGAYATMATARSEARRVGKKTKAEAEAAEMAFKKAAAGV
jgi:large subunit ribosomal protein L13e